jgi:hypothetical protein
MSSLHLPETTCVCIVPTADRYGKKVWVVLEGTECGVSINLDLVWVDILLFLDVDLSVNKCIVHPRCA